MSKGPRLKDSRPSTIGKFNAKSDFMYSVSHESLGGKWKPYLHHACQINECRQGSQCCPIDVCFSIHSSHRINYGIKMCPWYAHAIFSISDLLVRLAAKIRYYMKSSSKSVWQIGSILLSLFTVVIGSRNQAHILLELRTWYLVTCIRVLQSTIQLYNVCK
jgi:hypothetical protein